MRTFRQSLGRWGESLAAEYLVGKGYVLLERNFRTPYGEIDLILRQNTQQGSTIRSVVVFVEVKTRASASYGKPEESITSEKQVHLLAAVEAYLQGHPELVDDCRIDVISIEHINHKQPQIYHFENAIRKS